MPGSAIGQDFPVAGHERELQLARGCDEQPVSGVT